MNLTMDEKIAISIALEDRIEMLEERLDYWAKFENVDTERHDRHVKSTNRRIDSAKSALQKLQSEPLGGMVWAADYQEIERALDRKLTESEKALIDSMSVENAQVLQSLLSSMWKAGQEDANACHEAIASGSARGD